MNKIIPLQKKIFLLTSTLLVMLCLMVTGCDNTEKGDYKPYFFTMKILSVHGDDITPASELQNIRVLIFNSNEMLIDDMTMKVSDIAAGRAYTFYYENEGQITVACVGNTNSDIEIKGIELGKPITDFYMALRAITSASQSSTYLYYGINNVMPKNDGDASVVELQQVTGSINVEAYIPGSEEGEGVEGEENEEDIYTCRITSEYSRLNYEGEMTGNPIQYELPLTYSSSYGKWQSGEIILMPGKLLEVGIYKNGELFQAASSGDVFSVAPGINTTILFYNEQP